MTPDYKDLTPEKLETIIREQYYGKEDAQERRLTLHCFGPGCVEAFHEAMMKEAKRLGLTLTNEE